jgi:hypothetical protein
VAQATDREQFSEGYCHELALVLHARTGWELWTCVEPGLGGVHALVKLPDGRFLDIEGARSAAQVHEDWPGTVLRRVSARYFEEWGTPPDWGTTAQLIGPYCPTRTRRAATRLLNRLQPPVLAAA